MNINKLTISRRSAVLLILAIAFGLRVWGLSFGLPFEFHPDEGQYVTEALNWHFTGQLHVGTVNPPLFIYVLAAAYGPWLASSPFEPTTAWITAAYTFARLWSVAFGVLTVALVFAAGRRAHGLWLGLVAMALYAGVFLPAREAHFAVNDTIATFLVLLAIYAALGILRRGYRADYALAGVAVGLAAAAKLNLALVVLAVLAAHLLANPVAPFRLGAIFGGVAGRRWWGSLGLAGLTFAVVSLPIFWDAPRLVENLGKHLQFGAEGYKGLQMAPAGGWIYYLNVLGWGMGWLLLPAIAGGLGGALAQRFRPGGVLAVFPVALFLYMGAQKILFARFLLPAMPPLLILAGLGLLALTSRWPQLRRWWPVALAALLAQPLACLLWFNHLLTLPDTRQLATNWLLAQFPKDTVLVKESYSVLPAAFIIDQPWPFKTIQIDERGPARNDPDYYVQHKTNLIAVSNFTFARVRQEAEAEAARQSQLARLEQQAELIKIFSPYRSDFTGWFYLDELYGPAGEVLQRTAPGPLIKIYRLPYQNQPHQTNQPPFAVPVNANFGDKLRLLGYSLPQRRFQPGEAVPVTLVWQAVARLPETYVIFNRLLDGRQQPWGGYDRWPQETANTNLWHPGEVVVDAFSVPVKADAPPGVYTIDIGLYNQADPAGTPLPLLRDGQPIGQTSVRLGPLKIGGAPPGFAQNPVAPQHVLSTDLGQPPVIRLRGYNLARSAAALTLKLYWESLAPTEVDWSVFVHVRNAAGQTVAQKDGPAGGGQYPAALWDAGEIITDELTVPLPAELPPAEYKLVVGLYNLADGARLAVPEQPNNEILLQTWTKSP